MPNFYSLPHATRHLNDSIIKSGLAYKTFYKLQFHSKRVGVKNPPYPFYYTIFSDKSRTFLPIL